MRRPATVAMWSVTGVVVGVSLATASPAPTHVAAGSSAGIVTPTTLTPSATAVPRATATKAPAAPAVTVNGAAYDTRYGPVQVQITVRARHITAADAVQYPTQDGRDQEINSYAVPQLDQETLHAQSAHIDTVSGATYTSDGYRQSLQSAIDAAHKSGAL